MKHLTKLIIFGLAFIQLICDAQTYIGKNKFGKLEFINDSICTISFISSADVRTFVSTCFFLKHQDTLFLSTRGQHPVHVSCLTTKPINVSGYHLLIKEFCREKDKYKMTLEGCFGVYDTIRDEYYIDNVGLKKGSILVLQFGGYYRRMKLNVDVPTGTESLAIKLYDIFDDEGAVIRLDRFPLLIRGNKLIPIGNKHQSEECFIYNGFYFPIMIRTKKHVEYNTIPLWSLGLRGLPCLQIY